jgi:hypothetical protein
MVNKRRRKADESGKETWQKVVTVAATVPGRKRNQCLRRWATLDPANGKKGKWSTEEDTKLTEAVKKHYAKWVAVAEMVPDRTHEQCRKRWINFLDPANWKTGRWSPEEDAKLMEALKKRGKKWIEVAAMVPGRTNIRCRQRWVNTLDPDRASNTV